MALSITQKSWNYGPDKERAMGIASTQTTLAQGVESPPQHSISTMGRESAQTIHWIVCTMGRASAQTNR